MTLVIRGRDVLCACGAALLESDRLAGSNLFACRQPLHGRPLIWRVMPASAHALGAGPDETAVGRRLLELEADLAEIIRTSQATRGTSAIEAQHQDDRTARAIEAADPGIVAGVRVGPDDKRELADELRALASRLEHDARFADMDYARRVALRATRAIGEGRRAAPPRSGACSCGYVGRRTDHNVSAGTHVWREGPAAPALP